MCSAAPCNQSCASLPYCCKLTPVIHDIKKQLISGMPLALRHNALVAALPLDVLPPQEEHCSCLLSCKPAIATVACVQYSIYILAQQAGQTMWHSAEHAIALRTGVLVVLPLIHLHDQTSKASEVALMTATKSV